MSQPRDLSLDLADFFAGTRYETLPASAIEGAKKSVIDTIGVCLAASGKEPAVGDLVDLVLQSGGREEASVLAFGGRVPAMMAAFANGAMAHCLDYDDQTPWGQHSASSLLPAAFAAAERKGGVSGKQLIAAVAAGQDMFNRFRSNVDWSKDWNFSTVIGVFGAAAAASKLLGLSARQIAQAIGIASMQSCGTMEVINSTGSNMRAMYAGFPAKGAVLAALLAERDISGVPRVLEGRHGVLSLYFGGRYDRERIVQDLGREYTGGLTLYKRWPAVGTSHSHIHATIGLMTENGLSHDDLAEVRIHVGDNQQTMCDPLDRRRAPETLMDAKFSLPFLVAVAAVRRDMRLSDFSETSIRDPQVLACAQKVVPVRDPAYDWVLDMPPGKVVLVTKDGRRLERVGTDVPGSATNPMTWDDIFRKFADCAEAAVQPWSKDRIVNVQEMVLGLDDLENVSELIRMGA
jgi:2-methylcitrate dehydratase PrpD